MEAHELPQNAEKNFENKCFTIIYLLLGNANLFVCLFNFLIFYFRKLRYETDLAENMTWKIRFEDIQMKEQDRQEQDKPPQQQGMLSFKFNNLIANNLIANNLIANNPVR